MTDYKLYELQWLLNSPAFGRADNTGARQMRNEISAGWIDQLMERMSGPNFEDVKPPNTAATQHHTVSSMVEELKERVGLVGLGEADETLGKKAATRIPLSKSAKSVPAVGSSGSVGSTPTPTTNPDQTLKEMSEYIKTHHLRPTHGQAPPQALFDELKTKWGPDKIQELGQEPIMKMIEQACLDAEEPSLAEGLPKYDGTPITLKNDDAQGDRLPGSGPSQR